MDLLEEKQNRILKKLEDLKKTLISMRGDLNLCNKPAQPRKEVATSNAMNKKPLNTNLTDVIINVNPARVPFSILALKTQWKGRLNLSVEVFVHSTIKESEVTKAAKEFVEKVSAPSEENNLPTQKMTIIWKDVDTTQMILSPAALPIYGEVNIIRHLNRVGPNEFWYENNNQLAYQTDDILDLCHQLSTKNSVKERQPSLQQLGQRLGKTQYFNGSPSFSVADIAVSSTLRNFLAKEVPANLASWLQKVSPVAGY